MTKLPFWSIIHPKSNLSYFWVFALVKFKFKVFPYINFFILNKKFSDFPLGVGTGNVDGDLSKDSVIEIVIEDHGVSRPCCHLEPSPIATFNG